ncbi:MAG: symmetrical bis(5'-nucleosyl)-tetraphosphatase [Gammaproteobacteria bacterium]
MANFAIGDVQGCYIELCELLGKINFSPDRDKLWFVGDLINRGPNSLKTLDLIYSLKDSCNIVLGNHDLHLIAITEGLRDSQKSDTLDELLRSKEMNKYSNWLKEQPFVYEEQIITSDGLTTFLMSHAGIPSHWQKEKALKISNDLSNNLKNNTKDYLTSIYGNKPESDIQELSTQEKLRVHTNYLTRMRFVDKKGRLDLKQKGGLDTKIDGYKPWFSYEREFKEEDLRIIFGHWAALKGHTGKDNFIATDTGCVWGYELTAIELETGNRIKVKNSKI